MKVFLLLRANCEFGTFSNTILASEIQYYRGGNNLLKVSRDSVANFYPIFDKIDANLELENVLFLGN